MLKEFLKFQSIYSCGTEQKTLDLFHKNWFYRRCLVLEFLYKTHRIDWNRGFSEIMKAQQKWNAERESAERLFLEDNLTTVS